MFIPLLACCLLFLSVAIACGSLTRVWDDFVIRYAAGRIALAERRGINTNIIHIFFRGWGILVAVFVIFSFSYLKSFMPLVIITVVLMSMLPRVLLDMLNQWRERVLRDQLVGATVRLANATRASSGLAEAFQSTIEDIKRPLRTEFEKIVSSYRSGLDLEVAIDRIAARLQLEPFTLVAAAIKATRECGGELSTAMDRISSCLREHQRLERKMESNTASARRQAQLMASFPLIFGGLFYGMSPETTNLLWTTLAGQLVLCVVFSLMYCGWRWMKRVQTLDI